MERFTLIYSNIVVEKDIPHLGRAEAERIRAAIEEKLTTAPDAFGKPLHRPHAGLWSLRVGSYRVVYSLSRITVRILLIANRDHVYKQLMQRM